MEFSKTLINRQWIATIVLTTLVAVGCFLGKDMTALATVAGCSFLSNCVDDAFYFWKAKNENRAKYAQRFVRQWADKYGIEAAARIAEIVLKD